jgi:hypothetical protein
MEQKRIDLINFRNRMLSMANNVTNGLHLRSECMRDAMNAETELKRMDPK